MGDSSVYALHFPSLLGLGGYERISIASMIMARMATALRVRAAPGPPHLDGGARLSINWNIIIISECSSNSLRRSITSAVAAASTAHQAGTHSHVEQPIFLPLCFLFLLLLLSFLL